MRTRCRKPCDHRRAGSCPVRNGWPAPELADSTAQPETRERDQRLICFFLFAQILNQIQNKNGLAAMISSGQAASSQQPADDASGGDSRAPVDGAAAGPAVADPLGSGITAVTPAAGLSIGRNGVNTKACRMAAARVLHDAMPDAFDSCEQIVAEVLDTERFSIALTPDMQVAAVCVYRIVEGEDLETEGEDSWGQITWLAADPRQRKRGYGKAALAKALQAIQVQAESATFGLFANFLKDADEPYTAVDYYEKLRMRVLIRSDFTPVRAG
jgi:ribosomal protein S18 acetylase RimI-like enzyme